MLAEFLNVEIICFFFTNNSTCYEMNYKKDEEKNTNRKILVLNLNVIDAESGQRRIAHFDAVAHINCLTPYSPSFCKRQFHLAEKEKGTQKEKYFLLQIKLKKDRRQLSIQKS